MGLGQQAFGPRPRRAAARIVRPRSRQRGLGDSQAFFQRVALGDLRAAKHHDRRGDVVLVKRHLRLEQLQLQPHRPQLAPGQQRHVLLGQHVAGRIENGLQVCCVSFIAMISCGDRLIQRLRACQSRFNSTLWPIFGTSVFQPRSRRSSSARAVALANSPCVRNTCRGGGSGSSQRRNSRVAGVPAQARHLDDRRPHRHVARRRCAATWRPLAARGRACRRP